MKFFEKMLEKLDYRDAIDDMIECGINPESQSAYQEEKIVPDVPSVGETVQDGENDSSVNIFSHTQAATTQASTQAAATQAVNTPEPSTEPEIKPAQKQEVELIFKDVVQPAVEPVPTEPPKAVISLLLDTTYSMKEIYCTLYKRLMEEIAAVSSHKEIILVWRLVSIGDDGYTFWGELTTKELQKILSEELVLCGGSFTGCEDIVGPLKKEYAAIMHTEADVKGLLLLTDTLQQSDCPDNQPEKNNIAEVSPLNFCLLYVYDKTKFNTGLSDPKENICDIRDFLSGRVMPRLNLKIDRALETV